MTRQRMRDLLYHATNGGIVGDEAEELWDLYWAMEIGETERRRAAIKRDRKRVADLVRACLAPPGAELTTEAEQLVQDIVNGSRVRTPPGSDTTTTSREPMAAYGRKREKWRAMLASPDSPKES